MVKNDLEMECNAVDGAFLCDFVFCFLVFPQATCNISWVVPPPSNSGNEGLWFIILVVTLTGEGGQPNIFPFWGVKCHLYFDPGVILQAFLEDHRCIL